MSRSKNWKTRVGFIQVPCSKLSDWGQRGGEYCRHYFWGGYIEVGEFNRRCMTATVPFRYN